jgi:hypothetical protein
LRAALRSLFSAFRRAFRDDASRSLLRRTEGEGEGEREREREREREGEGEREREGEGERTRRARRLSLAAPSTSGLRAAALARFGSASGAVSRRGFIGSASPTRMPYLAA